jgi:hypothetical protein
MKHYSALFQDEISVFMCVCVCVCLFLSGEPWPEESWPHSAKEEPMHTTKNTLRHYYDTNSNYCVLYSAAFLIYPPNR